VIETLELEESVRLHEPPKLLVEWSSPWHEFVTSIRPALLRSERRLAGEAPFGLIPVRIMLPSYILEAVFILAAIWIQVKVAELRPFVAPRFSSHDVIYYSGDELPRTEDLGGAQNGVAGRAGGAEVRHQTQTIRVARGGSLATRIVDAPNLKLPSSRDAVANLLAIKPNPGPPPADGLRSSRTAPDLALVAPAPNVIRDYTRNALQLDSVVPPAPSVSRDRTVTAPTYSASVIPPAPNVAGDHALLAPALGPAAIPPAPHISRDSARVSPPVAPSVVAPAPGVAGGFSRSAPALATNVIRAAPSGVTREFSTSTAQMTPSVVPPPVSAPEHSAMRNPKLTLPATVIAPPPSDVSQAARRLSGSGIPDSSKNVLPPPPTQTANGSFMSSLMGKIFGPSEVVPPPPSVQGNSTTSGTGSQLAARIVPPPPNVAASTAGGSPRGSASGMGANLGNVVAPPPSVGLAAGTGTRSAFSSAAPTIGMATVVAPPPSFASTTGNNTSAPARTVTSLPSNVVAPPPSVNGASVPSGSGSDRRMALGASRDAVPPAAAPPNGGSEANAGAVLSSQPGSKVGLPSSGGAGSLAMSPAGADKPGLGATGNGTSIARGSGSGSSMNGPGPGAGKNAAGNGSDTMARNGISPSAGPGGAGNVPAGTPAVRGVDISGGTGSVTIPGFGSDSSASDPQVPGRTSSNKSRQTLGVTVVATANSGGAFEPYKNLLRGEKYTTYFETSIGTVVMEFADQNAGGHPFGGTLTAPTAMRTELGSGVPRARMVVTCTLGASGNLTNVHVLEAGPANMTARVIAALAGWKFQPALRGNQPVEVTAILGFGIDTNDRF